MKQSMIKNMILLTVIIMDLLTGMEFDLFVPGFPELQHYFGLTPFWVEALLSVNFIGYCLSLFFVGGLADRYGRKPIILLGLIIFVIGSILCVCTKFYFFILIGRFLQGIGIAAPAILSFLIIADSYPLKEQQFLMAMLNASLNIAAGFAPVIGSYLTLYFHWQGNFISLLILGLMALCMTLIFIPHSKLSKHETSLSLHSYIPIFQSIPLMLLITAFLISCVPYWLFVGISPLLYIKDLSISLSHFGYYQGSLAFIFALGSIVFGLIIKNNDFGLKKLLFLTILMFTFSFILFVIATISNSTNPLFITLIMLSFCMGQIIPSVILYPLMLNYMPTAKGRVSAVFQGGRLVLTAIGLQIAGYFYTGSFQNIGIIICVFVLLTVISFYLVMNNRELMQSHKALM